LLLPYDIFAVDPNSAGSRNVHSPSRLGVPRVWDFGGSMTA
jgi:hypothetical protein